MDDILGFLVTILVVVLAGAIGSKNKNRASRNSEAFAHGKGGRTARNMNAHSALRSTADSLKTAAPRDFQEAISAFRELVEEDAAPPARPAPARPVSIPLKPAKPNVSRRYAAGESFVDAEGCVGGSLPDHEEEGESRLEHETHLRQRDAEARANSAAPVRSAARISARDLRKAVVMAEILDRPKALRRSGSRL